MSNWTLYLDPGYFKPEWIDPEVMQSDIDAAVEEMSRVGARMPQVVVHGQVDPRYHDQPRRVATALRRRDRRAARRARRTK